MSFNEWKTIELKKITEKIGSGETPRGGSKKYIDRGIPFIRSQNIYDSHFKKEGLVYIDSLEAEKLSRVEILESDILINITGDSVARCTIVPKDLIGGRVNQHVSIIRADESLLNPDFLKYFLINNRTKRYLWSIASAGGTRNALTKTMLENLEIPLPELNEQEAIANILSTLDKKIELNNQMNKTLEEIAQAIYKSWFVDFEPFQDGEFYESELGLIPEGWEVFNIKDKCEVILGGTPARKKTKYWNQGNIPWIKSGKVNEFRIVEPSEYITEAGLNNSSTKLMPSGTTVIAITGATLGQVSRIEKKFCANQSVIGILESDLVPSEYIYLFIKYNIEKIIAKQTGGAQQHINKTNVQKTKILIPKSRVLKEFKNLIKPIFSTIKNNCFENEALRDIRDTLLPKLMSGEIRVPLEEESS